MEISNQQKAKIKNKKKKDRGIILLVRKKSEEDFVMSKQKKNQRGITLIALVVTIIVLMILAGVSINMIVGDNGLLTKAQDAADIYEQASSNEQSALDSLEEIMNGYLNDDNQGEKTLVEMYDSGELNIGDYVDYKNPTSGSYTAYATDTGVDDEGFEFNAYITDQVYDVSNNQLNWRVLGKDETTGGIKLIAGSPMKSNTVIQGVDVPYLFMYGAKAYVNGLGILNDIGALYKNEYAIDARSVNIEDINAITGVETEENIKNVNLSVYINGLQYGTPYNYTNQYTPESWINGKNTTEISGTVDGYAYLVNTQIDSYPYVTVSNTRAYEMLFDNIEYQTGKNYWLASSGTYAYQNFVGFSLSMVAENLKISNMSTSGCFAGMMSFFDSDDGASYGYYAGVRPVVILNPNVTQKQIPVIEDQTEETWNVLGN